MKHVLVTGGTGSVGRAVVDRLLTDHPGVERVVIYSRDEHKQGDMARGLSDHSGRLDFVLGDITHRERLSQAMQGVDTVIHAAAMRLVPHAEANPEECVRINVDGAASLANVVRNSEVARVVAISSDKAVSPTTIYGASKFAMERILLNAALGPKTRTSIVRYANVLNSRSSVASLFLEQRSSGVLTITDPEMTRFSIVVQDGVDLVMFALEHGWGGDLICPRAPSYRVKDMAEAIAPGAEHRVIGARPGEKMHEAMFSATEAPYVARRARHYVIAPRAERWTLNDYCQEVADAVPLERFVEYESGSNVDLLSVEEIRGIVRREFGDECGVANGGSWQSPTGLVSEA